MTIAANAHIHPAAIVEHGATIGEGCRIGPFCIIGPEVTLGRGVEVKSHAVITGRTEIGDETVVFPFATLGEVPQDLKFKGEATQLVIGARNRIREHVTMNTGTAGGGGVTRVGDDGLFMAGAHVAHDCQIGNRVILVNNAALAGHCILEDEVIVGGLSGVHQFVRIGRGAMIGAVTMVTADVIPHGLVQGPRGVLDGLNLVGLKRRGAGRADIAALRDLVSALGQGTFRDTARARAESGTDSPLVQEVLDFILGPSDRSFLAPR
ncbi:acyl-ACP--UDP-N-acetylglucosamine O-acyltransferase [Defluviimonas sp. WL0024]|uniref:Acyl-[acyl-carrier-protein]--UDP-N-acetylglucosamine O-acyltransferase n=2 Tax=Albidovulum TaxID=205889 RepID=A0ABT3IXH3_9RHOB|nr:MULTISPECIES: acyl-ACP--UDP-N-acetylglucosamine O-acyltransferase [Defluviimonas]MCU9846558.1 acyl-ACP--UDP-N-acetylglucosamine O-acyltransferase [Defluviimonas sp. WL0024]MCW3780137.1 acyl-ACP--UDP-N-acetylglucosamine O-acyltransferase [Defluviimonas salinarum]